MRSLFHVKEFPAPSIVGSPLQQAFITLSNHNLSMRLTDQKIDPDIPDGTILSQTPAAGQLVKPRQTVFVTIACQPQLTHAPDCIGKDYDTIMKLMQEMGIKLKYYYLPSSYPTNSCIGQSPRAGQQLSKEGMIIYLAKEREYQFIWPNFIGKPLAHALSFLEQHQITPQVTIDPMAVDYDQLIVADQRPLAGSIVAMEKHQLPIAQLYAQ